MRHIGNRPAKSARQHASHTEEKPTELESRLLSQIADLRSRLSEVSGQLSDLYSLVTRWEEIATSAGRIGDAKTSINFREHGQELSAALDKMKPLLGAASQTDVSDGGGV